MVDDLDRCPPDKAVEVLQSLVLLTENTPFVIFLAIDPRIVVTAIEVNNTEFFESCGINGYEYLDKIVQIPFAFPPLANYEKQKLFRGYLTGAGEDQKLKVWCLITMCRHARQSTPVYTHARPHTDAVFVPCLSHKAAGLAVD